MPFFDQTGPQGMGPMTGRGYGRCGSGFGLRRRFGAGRGLGRFFGWGTNLPQAKNDRIKAIADYKKALEEELLDIKKEEEDLLKSK